MFGRYLILSVGWLLLCVVAAAEDFTTLSGEQYKGVEVSRVEADGLVVMTDSGIAKIPFRMLPEAVKARYGYDPKKEASQAAANQMQAQAAMIQRTKESRFTPWVVEINRLRVEASAAPTNFAQSGHPVAAGEEEKRRLLHAAESLEIRLNALRELASLYEQSGKNDAEVAVLVQSVMDGMVTVGMPGSGVLIAWGAPRKVNRTLAGESVSEQWIYSRERYVYVDNGFVRSVQE